MLYHELEDGMYSVTSYFFAKVTVFSLQQGSTSLHRAELPQQWRECEVFFLCMQVLGELPEHCVFTLVYSLPIYWLAGLNEAPDRFLLNFLLAWLMVYCSRAMALFVAASLPTLQISAFMGNALFTVFYLTGGFVINIENMWLGEEAKRAQMYFLSCDQLPLTRFFSDSPSGLLDLVRLLHALGL